MRRDHNDAGGGGNQRLYSTPSAVHVVKWFSYIILFKLNSDPCKAELLLALFLKTLKKKKKESLQSPIANK